MDNKVIAGGEEDVHTDVVGRAGCADRDIRLEARERVMTLYSYGMVSYSQMVSALRVIKGR